MGETIASYFSDLKIYETLMNVEVVKKSFEFLSITPGVFGFLVILLGCAALAFVLINVGGLGTYAERKISADLQARVGPNRVGPFGLLQLLADGIKMLTKEDIAPRDADKFLFYIAPAICIFGVFGTIALLPISYGFTLSHLNVGAFFMAAVSSVVGVGIFVGGYASNSKWSLLGGMRGASQIVSYEIPVGISMLSVVVLSGGLSFNAIVGSQTGMPTGWFLFHNPFTFIGFFVFFIGGLAETNRAPFDLPEAESELVSGYHTEYTGIRFGLFALAEYIEIFVICGLAAALFLGGYNVPLEFLPIKANASDFVMQIPQVIVFFVKTVLLYYVVIWVRWTLPRLRVDQLMTVCWKYLTPISLFNLVGCLFWVYFFDGKSILDLILSATAGSGGGGH